jgi:hypothetical protein
MAGYAGVIMIETKKGFRINPEIEIKFNFEGFQFFSILGFTAFPEFPRNPPSDRYLLKKPTIYWDPLAETTDGVFEVKIKVPYGIDRVRIKVEGRSLDGEVIFEMIETLAGFENLAGLNYHFLPIFPIISFSCYSSFWASDRSRRGGLMDPIIVE